jgi:hypothetical protein
MRFHDVVERVRPKLTLRQRLQVIRSGSFNDVSGSAAAAAENRRRKWLVGRSESLRVSPWSSPESDRRGSLPPSGLGGEEEVVLSHHKSALGHSLSLGGGDGDDAGGGKVKGFVHR